MANTEQGRGPEGAANFSTGSLSIFDFAPDDLKANQRGALSPRQEAWLQSTARGIRGFSMSSATVAMGFVFFGTILILALYLQNGDSRAALFSSPLNLLLLAGAGAIGAALIMLSILLSRRQASAMENARLRTAQGAVRLDQEFSPGSGLTSYHVLIGGQRFSFSEDMGAVFQEGRSYKVYYVKTGPYQFILSLEPLAG